MKVAISSEGNDLKAKMDSRFGRCTYFAIYDTRNQALDFIRNPYKEVNSGAGPATASLLAKEGVSKVYGGHFGEKVKKTFAELEISMEEVDLSSDKTIEEIISSINKL